jgi:hypothetical protein
VNARNPLVARINFNLTCDFIMLPTTGRIHALAILNSVLGFSSLFTSLTLFFFLSIDWFGSFGNYFRHIPTLFFGLQSFVRGSL